MMRQRSQDGFTLLELTIVLFIVGLLAVGALKAASALRENAGISETSKRLDILVMALQTFLMKNNRLPCPADPKMDEDRDQNFGEEARNIDNDECALSKIFAGTTTFYQGVIPGRALGLSGGRLLDAWDRQFTYVVISEATRDNSFTSKRWPPTFKLFRPIDNQLDQLRQLNQGNKGIAVIISHGVNGSGAYLTDGRQTDPQGEEAGRFEKENIDADSDFVQAPYSTNERNPFDDQVLALTEDQIVQPLANQGALKTKQAQALERLKKIENTLIGFMVGDGQPPPNSDSGCQPQRKLRRRIPFADLTGDGKGDPAPEGSPEGRVPYKDLSLDESDVRDPWGGWIRYKTYGKVAETAGCEAGFYIPIPNPNNKDPIFKLTSRGPDGDLDGSALGTSQKLDIGRNISVIKSKNELQGILVAAGIDFDDPSDPPSNPTTKDSKNGPL
jgi:prepilin-type N-terminal cleavage/methylation domain-containing protein